MNSFNRFLRISNSTFLLSIAMVASALSLAIIFDYPELPFDSLLPSSSISSIFGGLLTAMSAGGLAGLFVLMFLESVSLPVPSELFLPLAGYFVFEGRMNFFGALLVSTAAGLAGSLVAYYLALALGRPVVYGLARKFGTGKDALEKSENWLNGKGSVAIFIARFVPGIRSSISLPAGALRMNMVRFSIMTLLGSLGWSAILIYVGYAAGPQWQASSNALYSGLSQAVPYLVVAASCYYVVYYIRKRRNKKS